MYTLRKITGEGVQMNFNLGNSYSVVTLEANEEQFKKEYELFWNEKHSEKSETYAFVSYEGGNVLPLYKNQFNYIMTDSGKTFSNLSLK